MYHVFVFDTSAPRGTSICEFLENWIMPSLAAFVFEITEQHWTECCGLGLMISNARVAWCSPLLPTLYMFFEYGIMPSLVDISLAVDEFSVSIVWGHPPSDVFQEYSSYRSIFPEIGNDDRWSDMRNEKCVQIYFWRSRFSSFELVAMSLVTSVMDTLLAVGSIAITVNWVKKHSKLCFDFYVKFQFVHLEFYSSSSGSSLAPLVLHLWCVYLVLRWE